MKYKISFLSLLLLSLLACNTNETEKVMGANGKYSLTLPSFLTEVHNLNEDASLQFQHAWKEFYVLAIDEPKKDLSDAIEESNLADIYSDDFEGYSKLILDGFETSTDYVHIKAVTDTTVNNMQTKIITFNSRVEGVDIYYAVGIYEGEFDYYQVFTWTLSEKEYSYNTQMNNILFSFQENKSSAYVN